MINTRLKIFLFVICFLVFIFLVLKLRKRKADIKYALSNSLGFGGHNAAVLFKKYED